MDNSETLASYNFAGFWRRLGAATLDGLLILAVGTVVFFILTVVFGTIGVYVGLASYLVGAWLYFAAMESSPSQATLGKKAFGIVVIDEDGKRITFGRASLRFTAKFVCLTFLGIPLTFAAFSKRKRGVHDRVAKTFAIQQ